MTNNDQFRLAARPSGLPKDSDWHFTTAPLADLVDGEIRIKTLYLSLDPAMRGWMNEGKSYIRPVAIDEVMRAGGIGVVVASMSPRFAVGDTVTGGIGVQRYWQGRADDKTAAFTRIDPSLAPLETWMNTLGMPGMTAYFGLIDVGQPKAGDTVVVSGAAGAVGQTVGQVAKKLGCRVVGIAGGKDKCDFVVDALGFDACIDYKNGPVKEGLKQHCPNGVDVYFDNVGGAHLDAALGAARPLARFAICGMISEYSATSPTAMTNLRRIISSNISIRGFRVGNHLHRLPDFHASARTWTTAGRFKTLETIRHGLEQVPSAFVEMLQGGNQGKMVVRL